MIVPVWNLMMSDSVVILFMAFCDMLILLSVFAVNAVCVLRKSILEKKNKTSLFPGVLRCDNYTSSFNPRSSSARMAAALRAS